MMMLQGVTAILPLLRQACSHIMSSANVEGFHIHNLSPLSPIARPLFPFPTIERMNLASSPGWKEVLGQHKTLRPSCVIFGRYLYVGNVDEIFIHICIHIFA